MKATGIIRRIDDLGRIIIPKEIRRNLHIREGDPLEIFVENDGVYFKKYSYITNIENIVQACYDELAKQNVYCAIYNTDEKMVGGNRFPAYIDDVLNHQDKFKTVTISISGDCLGYIVFFDEQKRNLVQMIAGIIARSTE